MPKATTAPDELGGCVSIIVIAVRSQRVAYADEGIMVHGDGIDSNDPATERDFYRRLLELVATDEPEPLLEQALAAVVAASGAQMVYLELRDPTDAGSDSDPRYWRAHGCTDEDVASIRTSISRGIIARTLAEGRTVSTPSATADPSFCDQESVLRNAIQAVLCAPIGRPPFGVVYLQNEHAGEAFTARNLAAVELFAQQLAMVADRLLTRQQQRAPADATLGIRKHFRCDGIVGRSSALARALREAAQAAPSRSTVLISGPTGTGKSALARAIAANGPRATAPFVELNCAAMVDSLIEAEMFGAEVGAYTGITKRMPGKIAAARGGTLFLDEVAELSLGAQAKLLQFLQERRYFSVGGTTPISADVRIISATNKDLKARVAEKSFRDDLYYRLAVITIAMPSLDDRRDDIPELVERFCEQFCDEACEPGHRRQLRPTRRALLACRETLWRGNIRELANAVEAAVARATFENADAIDEHHLFPQAPRTNGHPTFREATLRCQRRILEEALLRNDWNIKRTATELDLSRQHVHDLVSTLGLRWPTE
jgi:Nif-specific regulatory protein